MRACLFATAIALPVVFALPVSATTVSPSRTVVERPITLETVRRSPTANAPVQARLRPASVRKTVAKTDGVKMTTALRCKGGVCVQVSTKTAVPPVAD